MAKKESNILDIVQGLQQAASNGYDGATDESGEPLKTGLKRDEGNPIIDGRVMDGFAVVMQGDKVKITYHGEIRLEDAHDAKFEKEVEQMLADVVSFLKREYKKVTGKALTLTPDDKPPIRVLVQSTSRVRAWVQATKVYTLGGVNVSNKDEVQEKRTAGIKKWLDVTSKAGKKPKNVKIGKEENQKKEDK
jgi:hypothetical protein